MVEALDRYLRTYAAFTTAAALAEESTAYGAIARLLHEAAVAYTREGLPPGCLLITAATNCTPQSADIQTHLRGLRAASSDALTQKIATAIRMGKLPADINARALATFYAAVLQGMSAHARDGATRPELIEIATAALRAWPTALPGTPYPSIAT